MKKLFNYDVIALFQFLQQVLFILSKKYSMIYSVRQRGRGDRPFGVKPEAMRMADSAIYKRIGACECEIEKSVSRFEGAKVPNNFFDIENWEVKFKVLYINILLLE